MLGSEMIEPGWRWTRKQHEKWKSVSDEGFPKRCWNEGMIMGTYYLMRIDERPKY
jgi:hypothetical protein